MQLGLAPAGCPKNAPVFGTPLSVCVLHVQGVLKMGSFPMFYPPSYVAYLVWGC